MISSQDTSIKKRDEDRAVSPIIGTILMVAITVILASVISVFIFGAVDRINDTTPLANFDIEEKNTEYEITHIEGENINSNELYLVNSTTQTPWSDFAGIGDTVRPGDSITYNPSSEERLIIAYIPQSGDRTKVLFDKTVEPL